MHLNTSCADNNCISSKSYLLMQISSNEHQRSSLILVKAPHKIYLVAALELSFKLHDLHRQMEFAQLPWNCRCWNFFWIGSFLSILRTFCPCWLSCWLFILDREKEMNCLTHYSFHQLYII